MVEGQGQLRENGTVLTAETEDTRATNRRAGVSGDAAAWKVGEARERLRRLTVSSFEETGGGLSFPR